MKKWFFILLYLSVSYYGVSQMTFEKNYYFDGYEPYNISPAILNIADSGYTLISVSGDSNTSNNFLISITRLNKQGKVLWNKNSDPYTVHDDYGLGEVVQYPDSSMVLLWNDQDAREYRAGFAHVDKNGNAIWGRKYTPPSSRADIYINSFARTYDNGLIGLGNFEGSTNGLFFRFLLKTDSTGNVVWCKQYFPDSISGYGVPSLTSRITLTPDSGFLFTFSAVDSITFNGYGYLMKTDANGNVQWAKRYNPNLCIPIFTKPQISNGSIYFPTTYTTFDNIEVLKTTIKGIPIWNFAYTGSDMSMVYDGVTDSNGNTYLSGNTYDTLGFIFKIDSSGNIAWSYKYGKPDSCALSNLLLTSDGGVLGYGNGPIYYNGIPSQSLVSLVKTDSLGQDGCEQPFTVTKTAVPLVWQSVGIKVYSVAMTQLDTILNFHYAPIDTITECFGLATGVTKNVKNNEEVEVYPNPNNGIFTIALSHPELVSGSQTIVEIYNVLGEKVYSSTCQPQTPKGALIAVNIASQPNGIYFYRVLTANGELIGEGKVIVAR